MFWLASGILIITITINISGFFGLRKIKHMRDIKPLNNGPLISIIMAAKDEQQVIEYSIKQLLDQSYQNLEIIVVNDRSSDKTADIINRFAHKIKAIHIDHLPEGWLGKNHSCTEGAKHASGKYLLFIDADSRLEATTIARAVRHMEENELDLMSLIYDLKNTKPLTKSLIFDNTIESLKMGFAWNCRKRKSKCVVATGKFNMFRHDIYKKSGGYASIPLCVVDDVSIAKKVKLQQGKGDFVWGQGFIEVDWYKSPLELLEGTRKHLFIGTGFSLLQVMNLSILAFIFYILPLVGIFITEGYTQLLFLGSIIIRMIMFLWESMIFGNKLYNPLYTVFTFPFGIISLWYSTFHVLSKGGVEWAGKLYSIESLKECNTNDK